MWTVKIEDDGDELEIFAGKTRLVETKRPSLTPPSNVSAEQSPPQGQPQAQQSLPASDVAMYAALQGPPATVAGNAPAPVVNPMSQLTATGATQAATMGNAVNGGWNESERQAYAQMSFVQPTPSAPTPQQQQEMYAAAVAHGYHSTSPTFAHAPPEHLTFAWQSQSPTTDSHSQSSPTQAQPPIPQPQQQHRAAPYTHMHPHPGQQPYAEYIPQQYLGSYPDGYLRVQEQRALHQHQQPPSHPEHSQHPGMQQQQQLAYVPPPELVGLGLASRDSRLGERWTSFMHENGFLEGFDYDRTS